MKKKSFSVVYPTCSQCGDFKLSHPKKKSGKRPASFFKPKAKRSRTWGGKDGVCMSYHFYVIVVRTSCGHHISFHLQALKKAAPSAPKFPKLTFFQNLPFFFRIFKKTNSGTRNKVSIACGLICEWVDCPAQAFEILFVLLELGPCHKNTLKLFASE